MVDKEMGAGADAHARGCEVPRCVGVVTVFLLMASSFHAALACAKSPVSGASPAAATTSDCSRTGSVRDREACFLSLPEDQCRAIGTSCATVQSAHSQEAELTRIEKDILARARSRYASYVADDAEYLGDLQKSFTSSAAAWRTYRDAYCQAEPLVQGMSRDEHEALASDCRLRLTHSRIEQLKQLREAIP
jgi:uncharacterized protein YecT (DUF1311 family)